MWHLSYNNRELEAIHLAATLSEWLKYSVEIQSYSLDCNLNLEVKLDF